MLPPAEKARHSSPLWRRCTGADVAASTGRVGAAALGGTWDLTARAHRPSARPPLTAAAMAAYAGVLATKTWTAARLRRLGRSHQLEPGQLPATTDDIIIPSGGNQPVINAASKPHHQFTND